MLSDRHKCPVIARHALWWQLFLVIVRRVLQARDLSNDSNKCSGFERCGLSSEDYNWKTTSLIARHALWSNTTPVNSKTCKKWYMFGRGNLRWTVMSRNCKTCSVIEKHGQWSHEESLNWRTSDVIERQVLWSENMLCDHKLVSAIARRVINHPL